MTQPVTDDEPIRLAVDAGADGSHLDHFWSRSVGAGRANEGLRADWQDHLALVVEECGFSYVRFHGIFHDDMFVYRRGDHGTPVYYFGYLDALVDRLLEIGVRPFIELGFCPRDLARETETVFWWKGHGAPPRDMDAWGELVTRTVRHWTDRYGVDEVRHWYFEVWNEPNLKPFFAGTRTEYLQLYEVTARAVKAVDPQLRVGGPATSNFVGDNRFAGEVEDTSARIVADSDELDALDWQPVWLHEFLAWCHERRAPVDFVSCHPYPTDWALDEHGHGAKLTRDADATPRDLATLRKIVSDSLFPDAEIHLTQWSSSSSSRDHTHDHLQTATFVVHSVLESIGQVDSLSYWTFTDVFEEAGAGAELFHGGLGMITVPGVVKPTFHAYRMLHQLGDRLIAQVPGIVATKHSGSGRCSLLAYHYPPQMSRAVPASVGDRATAEATLTTGAPRRLSVTVDGLAPGASVGLERLTVQDGNALAVWKEMGAPSEPTREQLSWLRARARATRVSSSTADAAGRAEVDEMLEPWTLCLITAEVAAGR
ncbi:GH39 family glycosyl hydrolase [Phytoactinopolyspora endophytica]|uniref:GH39 family glycosyl hydrolase n=1 Tax=Phytoactinopolyspora endophytica TaxID=1642495 RepID=UPI00197B989C|nr:hypothetical protein [Phytoactinopolyspora endophytica]